MGEGYRGWLEEVCTAGTSHGLQSQQSLARYINLCFVWGPQFHQRSGFEWAGEILSDARLNENAKVHQLVYRTKLELAERAERR